MLSKTEQVWRHLIDGAHRGRRRWDTMSGLAADLGIPVSTTHLALDEPRSIDILRVSGSGGIRVLDPGRLLVLWAGKRRIERDVVDRFMVPANALAVEAALDPAKVVLGGFGAVTARSECNDIAAYSTVLAYGEAGAIPRFEDNGGASEIVLLQPDPLLRRYGSTTTLGQAWVDLFRTPGWQASRFVYELLPTVLTDDSDAVLYS